MSLFCCPYLLCWEIVINDLNHQTIDCQGVLTTLLGANEHPAAVSLRYSYGGDAVTLFHCRAAVLGSLQKLTRAMGDKLVGTRRVGSLPQKPCIFYTSY